MNNYKITWAVNMVLKLCIVSALIVGAATRQQYSYYAFLRWVVMIPFIYFSYEAYEQKMPGLLIYFIGVAIMFNPFHKVIFQKEAWHLIDYAIATMTTLTMIYDLTILVKEHRRASAGIGS